MATAAQIFANRRNAQKSTGPRTAAGKMRSRHNAYRHGLAIPVSVDIGFVDKIGPLASELAGTNAPLPLNEAARRAALAQLELARIQSVKLKTIDAAAQDVAREHGCELAEAVPLGFLRKVTELKRLSRYERRALSQRKYALRLLDSVTRELSRTKPVRHSTLFFQPAWVFNVHALVNESLERTPQLFIASRDTAIDGLRMKLCLRDESNGEIEFAFAPSYTLFQRLSIEKIARHGGRQWVASCPVTGKGFEELFLREGEQLVGSRLALKLVYRSKRSEKGSSGQGLADQLTRPSELERPVEAELLILPDRPKRRRPKEPETNKCAHTEFDRANSQLASVPSAGYDQSSAALAPADTPISGRKETTAKSGKDLDAKKPNLLKIGASFIAEGNLDAASIVYENHIENCEGERGRLSGKWIAQERYRTCSHIARLAFEYLLKRDFGGALVSIEKALAYYPNRVDFKIIKAHGLLFCGYDEQARTVYLEHIGKNISRKRSCNAYIQNHFRKIRRAGLGHQVMDEIESRLIAAKSDGAIPSKPTEASAETAGPALKNSAPPRPALPDDINFGDRAMRAGHLNKAQDHYSRALTFNDANGASIGGHAEAIVDLAANRLACLAFRLLLKRYLTAITIIEEVVSARPNWIWPRLVQAYVLMFTARKTEARSIHSKYYRQFLEDGTLWGANIRQDLAELHEAGWPRDPNMERIENDFAITTIDSWSRGRFITYWKEFGDQCYFAALAKEKA